MCVNLPPGNVGCQIVESGGQKIRPSKFFSVSFFHLQEDNPIPRSATPFKKRFLRITANILKCEYSFVTKPAFFHHNEAAGISGDGKQEVDDLLDHQTEFRKAGYC